MPSRRTWVAGASVALLAGVVAGVVVATNDTPDGAAGSGADMAMGGMEGMGGHDMTPMDTGETDAAPPDAVGGRLLAPTRVAGEKVFRIEASPVSWTIAEGVRVGALAYNRQVPGPLIRVTAGDRLRVEVTNRMAEPTSVHWHGIDLPNAMDGAGEVTQPNIMPGETFTYRFRVTQPGTFFYHSHTAADRQVPLGLAGALIVDGGRDEPVAADVPMMLGEWTVGADGNVPAMEMDGALPNWFTINGKSYPATQPIRVRVGQRVRLRFIGSGQFAHPMHIHGGPFRIVATDGHPVPPAARLTKDTVLVGPGERYDVIWTARRRGTWLVHCHILHHTTNDGREERGGGGLTTTIEVV